MAEDREAPIQIREDEPKSFLGIPILISRTGAPEDIVDKHARKLHRAGKISSLYEDESFERRLAVINEEAELGMRLTDLTYAFNSPELFDLIRHPVILDSVASLLGPEVAWTGSYVTRPRLP